MSEKNNIMKKILLTLGSIFLWEIGYAQLPVTDAAANGQLAALNSAINTLNGLLQDQNVTSKDNKYENYVQRILGNKNFDFVQKVEDYMWKADEFLKKGQEIKMIYDKEEDVLKKLKQLKRSASRYGNLDGRTYSAFEKNIRGTLSQVGSMVDNAQAILGNENTRMTTEGRREILKETLGELTAIEMRLEQIMTENKIKSISEEQVEDNRAYQENVDKSMNVFKKYNQKKGIK